jgi:hypothetical protein
MNPMQQAADRARQALNAQIRAHYTAQGQEPDYRGMQPSADVAADGRTVVLVLKFPDGFIATAVMDNLHARADVAESPEVLH